MKTEKKERFANWVFTIVLLALILPWSGIITRLTISVREQMSKPFISQELFDQKWGEVLGIFKQAKEKGKEFAALDYARGITRIALIQGDLEFKYRFDPRQAMILSKWKDNYGLLRETIKERDRITGAVLTPVLMQAMSQAQEEAGMSGLIYEILTKARIIKLLKWLFLFAWPVSLFPILLLYFRRCQIREISFKELVVLSPLKFLGCWIFGLIGLMMNYPGNDMAGLKRYLKLKNAYTRNKGWGYWLSKEEEAKLWQQARMPLERFDQRVQQTLAYSRVAAFLSSLFIWIFIAPFRTFCAASQKEQPKIAATTNQLTPKLWAYFQPQLELTKNTNSFSISKGRGFLLGNLSEKISYLVEVESVPTPTLVKAQLSLQIVKDMKVILGQQSSSFKFFNPDPSKRHLAVYALSALCTPTDDIGITLEGKIPFFDYRLSILNGTGTNKKDDNKDKDFVGYAKFSPVNWFSLIGCWQGGWQGVGNARQYRSGEWIQGEIKPFPWLIVKPTWVKRSDFEKDGKGWFVLSQAQINSRYQILVQYLSDRNSDKEWTVGGIICLTNRLRILPSAYYRTKAVGGSDMGLYVMAHINIGKDI